MKKLLFLVLLPFVIQAQTYYGTGITATDLNNSRIGYTPNYSNSYGFLCTHSDTLKAIRVYMIGSAVKPGYNHGNGGVIKYSLEADSAAPNPNHHPSGTVLAWDTIYHPTPGMNAFPLITFDTPVRIIQGQIYHIVMTNIDARYDTNYYSTDELLDYNNYYPRQKRFSDTTWFQLIKWDGVDWCQRQTSAIETPCLELYYADGTTFGMGYIQPFNSETDTVSGAKSIREMIIVTGGTKRTTEVGVSIRRRSGTSDLTFRLYGLLDTTRIIDYSPVLRYGGFETSTLVGWTTNSPNGTSTISEETSIVHSGTKSLKMTYPVGGGYLYAYSAEVMTIGQDYYYSFWARMGYGQLGVVYGSDVNAGTAQSTTFQLTSQWTHCVGKIKATTSTRFSFGTGNNFDGKTAYIDDARLWSATSTLIEQWNVPITSSDTTWNGTVKIHKSAIQLRDETAYYLTLTADASTIYETMQLQKGDSYDYSRSSYFDGGYSEKSYDGGATWAGTNSSGHTDRKDVDIQFYFRCDEPKRTIFRR